MKLPSTKPIQAARGLQRFHQTSQPFTIHHHYLPTSNILDTKLGVHVITRSTTTQASSSRRWRVRFEPAPSGTWDQHFDLLPGQLMHGAQVSSEIGHAIRHVAADRARRQAFMNLPVHCQRAAVLVDAAAVLAGYRPTCGGTC